MAEKRKMARVNAQMRQERDRGREEEKCQEREEIVVKSAGSITGVTNSGYSYLKHKHKCMSLPISIETLSLRHAEYELCV